MKKKENKKQRKHREEFTHLSNLRVLWWKKECLQKRAA
jgi:hypothetical protein